MSCPACGVHLDAYRDEVTRLNAALDAAQDEIEKLLSEKEALRDSHWHTLGGDA